MRIYALTSLAPLFLQGVQYPQSATGYAPSAAASTYPNLPQQQVGPRSQYSQYSNQPQALPQQPGVAGQVIAPSAYSNAGYGLTGEASFQR
jgi:hypothetical protein